MRTRIGVVVIVVGLGLGCDTRIDLGRPKPAPEVDAGLDWVPIGGGASLGGLTPIFDRTVGLHVTLTWTTPGDPDPGDAGVGGDGYSLGSDLDLHLVRPGATDGPDVDRDGVVDGWFDPIFDVYFHRQRQLWGAPGTDDDPLFFHDVTDGDGPEEVVIRAPEPGLCYRVGVHAWDDWGFGASDAVVVIAFDGQPIFTSPSVRLDRGDLWDAARVCWPGAPTAVADLPVVMQGYPVPERVRPL